MTVLPALMNNSIFNDIFDDPFFNTWDGNHRASSNRVVPSNMMNTDIREKDGKYELDIDMPGFTRDDVKLHLEDGYLVVSAEKQSKQGSQDDNGKWIRRERYSGSCSRSFYVGRNIAETDIRAKFENGTLHVSVLKDPTTPVETKKEIAIEG